MLVSVLVERYQRVYTRKLYINEETIDFDDFSDDDAVDNESKLSGHVYRRKDSLRIEDPDRRAKNNAAFNNETMAIDESRDSQANVEIGPSRNHGSGVRFIIGFVNDGDDEERSQELLQKVTSVIADDTIHLELITDEQIKQHEQLLSPGVQFTIADSSNDDDDEFTEIVMGCETKGNILKNFRRPSLNSDKTRES